MASQPLQKKRLGATNAIYLGGKPGKAGWASEPPGDPILTEPPNTNPDPTTGTHIGLVVDPPLLGTFKKPQSELVVVDVGKICDSFYSFGYWGDLLRSVPHIKNGVKIN